MRLAAGDNVSGKLGDGSTDDSAIPVQVTGGSTFANVAAGGEHSCAITLAGALLCWGEFEVVFFHHLGRVFCRRRAVGLMASLPNTSTTSHWSLPMPSLQVLADTSALQLGALVLPRLRPSQWQAAAFSDMWNVDITTPALLPRTAQ